MVGTGPGTEKNTRDGRKKRTNGTWRPSLREALDRFAELRRFGSLRFAAGILDLEFESLLKSDSYSSAKALASNILKVPKDLNY